MPSQNVAEMKEALATPFRMLDDLRAVNDALALEDTSNALRVAIGRIAALEEQAADIIQHIDRLDGHAELLFDLVKSQRASLDAALRRIDELDTWADAQKKEA